MEKKPKKKYIVYYRFYYYNELAEKQYQTEDDWDIAGETWATSESKAINNVRYRAIGKMSQYKPTVYGGYWERGIEWKAKEYLVSPVVVM